MRTTVAIDEDLAARLRELARKRGVPFTRVLNEALRSGLAAGRVTPRPFEVESRDMGARTGIELDKALATAAELEDRELLRKRTLAK